MSASPVGRNEPCPCGSGKKYKKCCQANEPVVRDTAPPVPSPMKEFIRDRKEYFEDGLDRLDEISNSAVDAIRGKRYEEAEKICEQLLRDYSWIIDGHDRLGMLREAQGRYREAADHYAQVLEMIEKEPEGFDREVVEGFRARRQEALSKAAPQP